MDMVSEFVQKIEGDLKWKSLEDSPLGLFGSFEELKRKIAANEIKVGVHFTIAAKLANRFYGKRYRLVYLLLCNVIPILGLLSIFLAIYLKDYWLLFGVILVLLGFLVATPYNPLKKFFDSLEKIVIVVFLLSLFLGKITASLLSAFFIVPYEITGFIHFLNQQKLKKAALSSEKFFLYLYQTHELGIKNNSTGESYWYTA